MHSKHYESRKAKTAYIWERREYILACTLDKKESQMMISRASIISVKKVIFIIYIHEKVRRDAYIYGSTPSVLNYSSFEFFNLIFGHSSYLKNMYKYHQI